MLINVNEAAEMAEAVVTAATSDEIRYGYFTVKGVTYEIKFGEDEKNEYSRRLCV